MVVVNRFFEGAAILNQLSLNLNVVGGGFNAPSSTMTSVMGTLFHNNIKFLACVSVMLSFVSFCFPTVIFDSFNDNLADLNLQDGYKFQKTNVTLSFFKACFKSSKGDGEPDLDLIFLSGVLCNPSWLTKSLPPLIEIDPEFSMV